VAESIKEMTLNHFIKEIIMNISEGQMKIMLDQKKWMQ
jgi:hypothetical protein